MNCYLISAKIEKGTGPVGIAYCPEDTQEPIQFWEGAGPFCNGISITPQAALSEKYLAHAERAGGSWFIPFVQQMAKGMPIGLTHIKERYQKLYGKEMRSTSIGSQFYFSEGTPEIINPD